MRLNFLNKNQYSILVELEYMEHCKGYDRLEGHEKELKKEIKLLREYGYVEYHRGLMTEEGEVAGSGFCRNMDRNDEINELIAEYELTH